MPAGSHAPPFGGSPRVCAASLGVFEAIEGEGLLENSVKMGEYIEKKFNDLKQTKKVIEEVKGIGLMIGVKLGVEDASSVANECMKKGLLINCTQKNILRIMPPMTITKEDIDLAMEKITEAMETL